MTQSRFSCWLKGQSKGALGGLAMGQQLAVGDRSSGSWITGPFSALVHGLKSLITSENYRLLQPLDASEWEHLKDYGCFWLKNIGRTLEEHWKDYMLTNWALANLSQKHISAIRPERDDPLDLPFTICKIWLQGLAKHWPWLIPNINNYEWDRSRAYHKH
jgi:hypothetical protein